MKQYEPVGQQISTSQPGEDGPMRPSSFLFPDDDALDAAGDGGEDLVGDGAEDTCQFGDRGVGAEDRDGVAHFHVHAGDVQHAHVHADVPDGGDAVPVHREGGLPAAQVTVDAVGVTHGDGGDDRARAGFSPSAVSHRVSFPQVLDLQDLALERGDG